MEAKHKDITDLIIKAFYTVYNTLWATGFLRQALGPQALVLDPLSLGT